MNEQRFPSEPPADALRIEDLRVRRADERTGAAPVDALRGVSMGAPVGEVTAIVGSNGAGKTTLLSAITGALVPGSGRIEVMGERMGSANTPLPAGVSMVPDQAGYPEDWDAHDVAKLHRACQPAFDPAAFGARPREKGVPLRRRVRDMSRGQIEQLLLSAALAARPRLLLLDEPFARLDPLGRSDLADELRDLLAGEGCTVVLTTHDLEGMDRLVDHLVILDAGRTVVEGAVWDLCEEHVVVSLPESAADGARDVLIGAQRDPVSGGTDVRALITVENAASLPPRTEMLTPTLVDIVTFTLRDGRERSLPHPRPAVSSRSDRSHPRSR